MGAGALHCALFFPATTLSALAANDGIRLQDEEMSPNGFYRFFFEATSGQKYPIAVSHDLLQWTLLTNVDRAEGPVWFEDQDAAKFQQRFYRIGEPKPVPTPVPTPIPNMVFISPGTFTMGSPASEGGRDSNEGPQTVVTLSLGFWMGRYEVTQMELMALTGANYSFYISDSRLPVDNADWLRATNYCHLLTVKERTAGRLPAGYAYRLPTEAEWEYACRAGTTTPVGVGDGASLSSTQANFDGGFPYGGAAAGQFANLTLFGGFYAPNAWGLYDMHGNVWEWCQDWYGPYPGGNVTDPKGAATGTTRVLRGGGYTSTGRGCRSAKRDSHSPSYAHPLQGFRVVLSADSASQ